MKNVGKTDKIIRIIIGLVLLSMFFFVEGNAKYFGILGLIPLYTGISGKCFLYKVFGISTRKDQ